MAQPVNDSRSSSSRNPRASVWISLIHILGYLSSWQLTTRCALQGPRRVSSRPQHIAFSQTRFVPKVVQLSAHRVGFPSPHGPPTNISGLSMQCWRFRASIIAIMPFLSGRLCLSGRGDLIDPRYSELVETLGQEIAQQRLAEQVTHGLSTRVAVSLASFSCPATQILPTRRPCHRPVRATSARRGRSVRPRSWP